MRKVLLATTALVTLGGVSAATADVTISGAYEMKYMSWSDNTASTTANNTSLIDTTTVTIGFSETFDNGMSASMSVFSNGNTTGAFDTIGATLSGDFGTLGMGHLEQGDAYETATDVTPEEAAFSISKTDTTAYNGTNDKVRPADAHVAKSTISYTTPSMGGLTVSAGMTDTAAYNDATSMGAQYVMSAGTGSVTLKYAASSTGATTSGGTDEIDATSAGVVLAMGAATLTVADNTVSYGTTTDYSASSAGITYVVSDQLTLSAYTGETEDGKDAAYKFSDTGVGAVYTIVPGMTVGITHNSWDWHESSNTEDGDQLAIALGIAF